MGAQYPQQTLQTQTQYPPQVQQMQQVPHAQQTRAQQAQYPQQTPQTQTQYPPQVQQTQQTHAHSPYSHMQSHMHAHQHQTEHRHLSQGVPRQAELMVGPGQASQLAQMHQHGSLASGSAV